VKWVWASRNSGDLVTVLTRTSSFQASYRQAFANGTITIYTRIGG
jgi:hypothetical protein